MFYLKGKEALNRTESRFLVNLRKGAIGGNSPTIAACSCVCYIMKPHKDKHHTKAQRSQRLQRHKGIPFLCACDLCVRLLFL
jgi:hypothetical protein